MFYTVFVVYVSNGVSSVRKHILSILLKRYVPLHRLSQLENTVDSHGETSITKLDSAFQMCFFALLIIN